ncbi:MAG TPA: dienelactone hydrolase family protein [Acidimicrobiales bacterium]|nr:dienelactone hydrolase family protein [Acidimicrobiales bacterium]
MGQLINLGGDERGYLATPEVGAGPGLVVIHEHGALDAHIEDVCDRFAGEGFSALALDSDEAMGHLGAAVEYLRSSQCVRGDGLGVVGFGRGAGLALTLAAQHPDDIDACVAFYPLTPSEPAQTNRTVLDAPVQGHFAEQDEVVSPDEVRRLEAALNAEGKDTDFHFYAGAGHGFFDDTRPEAYEGSAAALAWIRTLEFLRAKLG